MLSTDLRQIRYFLCAAEEKNISAAAQKLNITQPPLSRSIASLEQEIGTLLFVRGNNGLVLTKAGLLLQRRGQELLDMCGDITEQLKRLADSSTDRIVIGSNDASNVLIAPQFIKLFRKTFCNVEVISHSGSAIEIIDGLRNNEIDIGFLRFPIPNIELFDTRCLLEERWIAVTSIDYPLLKDTSKAVTLKLLSRYPLIMPSRESLHQPIIAIFNENHLTVRVRCFYFELENGLTLAKSGIGIAVMPSCTPKMFKNDNYRILEISDLNLHTYFGALKRRDDKTSEIIRNSWEIIKKHKFSI